MDCQTVQHHLSAYLDRDVSPGTRQLLDEHFACCPRCRGELGQFQIMTSWIRGFPTIEPSATFRQEVCARVEHLPAKSPAPWFRRLSGFIPLQAAAALVVAVSAVLLWQVTPALWHRQEPQVPPATWVEPWLSPDSPSSPLTTPPPLEPLFDEPFPAPAPFVQASPLRPLYASSDETGRMVRGGAAMPTMFWAPPSAPTAEVAFFPSVVLHAADPVQAAQQIWEIVPQMGGALLHSQGMVTPAGKTTRGPVKVTMTLGTARYLDFLKAIRQLSGTHITEERVAFISRGLQPMFGGPLWRLDYSQAGMTSQMTLVLTILPRQ